MAATKKVRAAFIELYSRIIDVVKNDTTSIYKSGHDNLYPYEIERNTDMSPTATRAIGMMASYISGKGVVKDELVNKKKGYMTSDIVDLVAEDLARQYGSFIWIGYGINEQGEIFQKTLDVMEYPHCRISKEDDNEYPGKVYVKDYSKASSLFRLKNIDDTKWYYPYNSNKDVVLAQIKADAKEGATVAEMVQSYRGQVFYLNLTPRFKYALSKFDSVFNDVNSEYQFSLYSNTQLREGFLGKIAVLTQGLDEEEKETVKKDLGKWLGAEGSGGIYHLGVDQAEDLSNILRIEQLKPQFDDKLFVETDKRIRRNILGAANNIPEPLIYSGEGALFGTSADAYTQMKLFYQEQTEKERDKIEKTLTRLGFETKIIPIIPIPNIDATTDKPK